MGRRKHYSDEGKTLFDKYEPLTLPPLEETNLLSSDDFIIKTREALGKISLLSNACLDLTMENRAPRHDLADYLMKMSKVVNLAITSHQAVTKEEGAQESSDININFIKKNPSTTQPS